MRYRLLSITPDGKLPETSAGIGKVGGAALPTDTGCAGAYALACKLLLSLLPPALTGFSLYPQYAQKADADLFPRLHTGQIGPLIGSPLPTCICPAC
jgi:hypothetical protein